MGTLVLPPAATNDREKHTLITHEPVRGLQEWEDPPATQVIKGLCFMTTIEEIQEELAHLKALWHEFNRRKKFLELSEARQGIGNNVTTSMELTEILKRMDEIEGQYHSLEAYKQLTSE